MELSRPSPERGDHLRPPQHQDSLSTLAAEEIKEGSYDDEDSSKEEESQDNRRRHRRRHIPPPVGFTLNKDKTVRRRMKALQAFELIWNILAVIYLVRMIQTSRFIPQHQDLAGTVIQQTKVWLTGTPDLTAWSSVHTKRDVVQTLNSTVLESMYNVFVTHIIYHFHCDDRRRRLQDGYQDEEAVVAPGQPQPQQQQAPAQGKPQQRPLPTVTQPINPSNSQGDDDTTTLDPILDPGPGVEVPSGSLLHDGKCEYIPTHVPHRGGVWMYVVSRNKSKNKGCNITHEAAEQALDTPWRRHDYLISGRLAKYRLPEDCSTSSTFEVMTRGDEPTRQHLNDMADWVDINFQADTEALIVISQLYWEPALKFDSFGVYIIEQTVSGFIEPTSYFYARDYRETDKTDNGFNIFIATIMILLFGWWCGVVLARRYNVSRIITMTFPILALVAFTPFYVGTKMSQGKQLLLALPIVVLSLVVTVLNVFMALRNASPAPEFLRTNSTYDRLRLGERGTTEISTANSVLPPYWNLGPEMYYLLIWLVRDLMVVGMIASVCLSFPFYSHWDLAWIFIYLLWLLHIVVGSVVIRFGKAWSAWDFLDLMMVACAIWMTYEYNIYINLAQAIKSGWTLSYETACFMASKGSDSMVPFSLVTFLAVVRLLRYVEIFPVLCVPWSTFTRSVKELLAYTVVFMIIMVAFSLMFMYLCGGDLEGMSGLSASFMSMVPTVFGGNVSTFYGGPPSIRLFQTFVNLFYVFTSVFFVANILLAIVLDHYAVARRNSKGQWMDPDLVAFMKDKLHRARDRAPVRTRSMINLLEGTFTSQGFADIKDVNEYEGKEEGALREEIKMLREALFDEAEEREREARESRKTIERLLELASRSEERMARLEAMLGERGGS